MIQLLRGIKSTLESSQTVFSDGQPIFEKDTGQLKIGNGVDTFSSLPYVGASSSGSEYPKYTLVDFTTDQWYIDLSPTIRITRAVSNYTGNYRITSNYVWPTGWTSDDAASDAHKVGLSQSQSYQVGTRNFENVYTYPIAVLNIMSNYPTVWFPWFGVSGYQIGFTAAGPVDVIESNSFTITATLITTSEPIDWT